MSFSHEGEIMSGNYADINVSVDGHIATVEIGEPAVVRSSLRAIVRDAA